jgi:hypothetical protein
MSTDGVSRAIRWRASHNKDISTQAYQQLHNEKRKKCRVPSLTRRRVCGFKRNHSMVQVAQNQYPYFTVSPETPSTLRTRFSIFISPRNKVAQLYPRLLGFLICRSQSYFTTDGLSVSMSWCRAHSGTCDQILLPVGRSLSESCSIVSVGRPLWREDGSAVCNAITEWSESRRTSNHTLLLSETTLIWRARFPYLYPSGTEWPNYTPGHWVPFFCRLLRLSWLRWGYSNPPPPASNRNKYQEPSWT